MGRVRSIATVLMVVCLLGTGCAVETAGSTPVVPPSASQPLADGLYLHQKVRQEPAKTYEGNPTFDPCAILTLDLATAAGFQLDPTNEYHDEHFTANANKGSTKETNGSQTPAGVCNLFPKGGGNWVCLLIEQIPFQDGGQHDIALLGIQPEYLTENGLTPFKDEIRGNIHIVTASEGKPGETAVTFMSDSYWATLTVHTKSPSELTKPADQVLQYLTDHIAEKLQAGPNAVGQTTFAYRAPFNLPSPCSLYRATDFPTSFHEPELGRVEEVFQLGKRPLYPDLNDPDAVDQGPWNYVSSSCVRVNHALVDSDATQQQLTIRFETFEDLAGAEYANNWDCSEKYQHPDGQPVTFPIKIGDGSVCLIPTGGGLNPDFTFKAGRTVVYIHSFSHETFKDQNTALGVLQAVSEQIASRLV